MIKYSSYDGHYLMSVEIDGAPYADMRGILELAIPGSWDSYQQVLNGDPDIQFDLDIRCIDNKYYIPVIRTMGWLYSIAIRNMHGDLRDRFRVFRRDVEKVLRVTWGLPAEELVMRTRMPYYEHPTESGHSMHDLADIFSNYGVPEDHLQGVDDNIYEPLHYLELIASSTYCGPRGYALCDMINSVDDLPQYKMIREHINAVLLNTIPDPTNYLDDYLDDLNVFISLEASRFVGEYNAE